jgi:hypothetical protein
LSFNFTRVLLSLLSRSCFFCFTNIMSFPETIEVYGLTNTYRTAKFSVSTVTDPFCDICKKIFDAINVDEAHVFDQARFISAGVQYPSDCTDAIKDIEKFRDFVLKNDECGNPCIRFDIIWRMSREYHRKQERTLRFILANDETKTFDVVTTQCSRLEKVRSQIQENMRLIDPKSEGKFIFTGFQLCDADYMFQVCPKVFETVEVTNMSISLYERYPKSFIPS